MVILECGTQSVQMRESPVEYNGVQHAIGCKDASRVNAETSSYSKGRTNPLVVTSRGRDGHPVNKLKDPMNMVKDPRSLFKPLKAVPIDR